MKTSTALAALALLAPSLALAKSHITRAPEAPAVPTTTVTTCAPSSIQLPAQASGFNPHTVCGTQCTAEYPLCNCVQYSLYSWYCGDDPYDTDSSTYYGCCQDWGNGTYGCFCDGTPGAPGPQLLTG